MIRFVLKSALALGLLATVLPLGNASRIEGTDLDLAGVANGVREAVEDLGGFCGRAPAACDAGRQVAAFAGERIEDGFRLGVGYLNERRATAEASHPTPVATPVADVRPDPVTTGAVELVAGPRPYMPPRPVPAEPAVEKPDVLPVRQAVAVPTPAPRG